MVMWTTREVLGFDFETTGIDRFNDVPVSYALVTVIATEVTDIEAGLIDPGRPIPEEATAVHGISNERARAEGLALPEAIKKVSDAVLDASRRGVPLVGMCLDYDLTLLDTQCARFFGQGLVERGWNGPVLDASVVDRHVDRYRPGRRTLSALCELYGIDIGNAHDASADAIASVNVLIAMFARYGQLRHSEPAFLHEAQKQWHKLWAENFDEFRRSEGLEPLDRRDQVWPVAPSELPPAQAV
jgi:DNA polymerase-3 subunit epsilon